MATGQYLEAIKLSPKSCIVTMTVQDELSLVVPGRAFKPKAKNDPLTQRAVDRARPMHELIQRTMTGRKLTNATKDLPEYIRTRVLVEDPDGPLGDLGVGVLYTPDELEVEDNLVDVAGRKFIYLDAESRGEGKLKTVEDGQNGEVDKLLAKRTPFLVWHGISPQRAAAYFGDYNGKGQPVTPNLIIARDTVDPFATTSQDVFKQLGLGLELEKRQVAQNSDAVLTALSARLMTGALFHGVNVVQFGSRTIPETAVVEGVKMELDSNRLYEAGVEWFGHLFGTMTPEAFKDRELVLRSVPVLVSLAAIGRELYTNPKASVTKVGEVLEGIDWRHDSEKWDGIAGKRNAAGRYSVGSGKEAAHATFAAITKADNPGFDKIRS